jgi:hypothetical protein
VHRHLRLSCVVSSFVIVGALAGCGSDGDEQQQPATGPAPSEAVVFDATQETKDDLGIAKWGFATDDEGDHMTYRGYGANNEVLATVVQDFDRRDPKVYHFTMTMNGPKGSASEKIDFSTRPSADGTKSDIVVLVTENTFEEGSYARRVLDRFGADSAKRNTATIGQGTSLTGQSLHTLDDGLVSRCQGTADRCQAELIDQRIAANAASGNCSLLNTVGQPLISCAAGALVGGIAAIWTGPGVIAGAGIGCAGGAVGTAAWATTQCVTSRRDANEATQKLNQCRQQSSSQCQQ